MHHVTGVVCCINEAITENGITVNRVNNYEGELLDVVGVCAGHRRRTRGSHKYPLARQETVSIVRA